MKNNTKRAFTLAEVLITLSIIGVVAALTIPSLITKNQEKETIVQLKKAYSILSSAFSLAQIEYGEPSGWGWGTNGSLEGSKNAMDKLSPYLNITRRCDGTKGCFPNGVAYKKMDGGVDTIHDNLTDRSKAILADGMSFNINNRGNNCNNSYGEGKLKNVCASVYIDVNGFKGPNALAKDTFAFHITSEGIVPYGIPKDQLAPLETCRNASGWGCTAWALLKENMDYPPAGVGWDGETTSNP